MEKIFYIGTYTESTRSRGIYSAVIDEDGMLDGLATETNRTVNNPSYLCTAGNKLYAIEEVEKGSIVSFNIGEDGALEEIGRNALDGRGYCHVTAYENGRMLAASAYGSGGVSICPVDENGVAGEAVVTTKYEGHSVDFERQSSPHTHSSIVSPDGKWLLVCDLGLDCIFVYESAPANGELKQVNVIAIPAGSGPRHMCFSSDGSRLYVVGELKSLVFAYSFNSENAEAQLLGSYTTLPDVYAGINTASDVHLSADGEYLYVSNRGYDSIAVFRVGDEGTLSPVDVCRVDVKWPRSFAIFDIYMIVAGQFSNNVIVYRLNQENGKLKDRIAYISVPSPVCICLKD